ncbi:glycosyltransferase [uncultured Arcticibacterium sp.]|uniref:glycosyltransferase n=1 Tax=uncultured Arcticibacterium sp. TaxID=2173042 RepID=UPI0030FBEC22
MKGISLIICCYNSEEIIEQTLSYVEKQVVSNVNWEVILIDNNSTDNTSAVVKSFWDFDKNPNLKVFKEENPGLSNARLRGIKESQFDIISFVDDDNLIPENWVAYVHEVFKNQEVGVLGCTSIGKFDYPIPDWYEKHKLSFATGKLYEVDFGNVTYAGLVYGAGMSMRKEIFKKLDEKGWEPYLSDRVGKKQSGGGDSELTLASRLLGYQIFYSNQINTQHLIKSDRLTWERLKAMIYGFGEADVFVLPYAYQYKKAQGLLTFFDKLRKKWWVNYLGKKVALTILRIKKTFGKISPEDFEIAEIRNQAFCTSLLEQKRTFENSFDDLSKLQ